MITRIGADTAERLVRAGNKDVFALKILSLLRAYGTGYDFCSFYAQRDMLIGRFYGEFIISLSAEAEQDDIDELTGFLAASGFVSVLCCRELCEKLNVTLSRGIYEGVLLEYGGDGEAPTEKPAELDVCPDYWRVYEILVTGFPELPYEDWYVDTNHRVRHGISRVLLWRNCVTATVSYELYGSALLTMVASDKNNHIKGAAAELLRLVGAYNRRRGIKTQIICRRELIPFYEKADFSFEGEICTLK